MARVYVCNYEGCTDEATAGKFGHTYCDTHNELVKQEKQEAKQREKELRESAPPPLEEQGGLGGVRTPPRAPRRNSRADLTQEIKDAVMTTAAVASIRDPRIFIAVEATVDEFAISWNAVARQSPAARKYIVAMLSGGVWIAAFGATLAMVVTTLYCTEKLPPNLEMMGAFFTAKAGIQVTRAPQAPLNGNGGGDPVGASEAVRESS